MVVVVMAGQSVKKVFDLEKLAISISFQTDVGLSRLTDRAIKTNR